MRDGQTHTLRATSEEEPVPSGGNHQGRTGKTDKLRDDRRQPAQGAAARTGAGSLEEMPRLRAKAWSRTEERNPEGSPHRAERRTDGEECVFFLWEYESLTYLLLLHSDSLSRCHTPPDHLAALQQHEQQAGRS